MVYCIGLENRRGESLRGFESLPVRDAFVAELADAPALGAGASMACGFDPLRMHSRLGTGGLRESTTLTGTLCHDSSAGRAPAL